MRNAYLSLMQFDRNPFKYAYFFFISDHTRLGHWILDGDPAHSHLLRFALTEDNFTDTTGKYKFLMIKSSQFYSKLKM